MFWAKLANDTPPRASFFEQTSPPTLMLLLMLLIMMLMLLLVFSLTLIASCFFSVGNFVLIELAVLLET